MCKIYSVQYKIYVWRRTWFYLICISHNCHISSFHNAHTINIWVISNKQFQIISKDKFIWYSTVANITYNLQRTTSAAYSTYAWNDKPINQWDVDYLIWNNHTDFLKNRHVWKSHNHIEITNILVEWISSMESYRLISIWVIIVFHFMLLLTWY